jgi:hypothetical protein
VKNRVPDNELTATDPQDATQKLYRVKHKRCSICTSSIWFRPIVFKEPPGAPEPRCVWALCKYCHEVLLAEMRRSPVRSPLRLRIAMGIVASERSPEAYGGSTHISDQRRFIGIAWVLIIAMLLHLVLIVILAAYAR